MGLRTAPSSRSTSPGSRSFKSGRWLRRPTRSTSVGMSASSQRSEEHTSELQSLMRISSAVFCLKKKNTIDSNSTDIAVHQNQALSYYDIYHETAISH